MSLASYLAAPPRVTFTSNYKPQFQGVQRKNRQLRAGTPSPRQAIGTVGVLVAFTERKSPLQVTAPPGESLAWRGGCRGVGTFAAGLPLCFSAQAKMAASQWVAPAGTKRGNPLRGRQQPADRAVFLAPALCACVKWGAATNGQRACFPRTSLRPIDAAKESAFETVWYRGGRKLRFAVFPQREELARGTLGDRPPVARPLSGR